MIIGKFTSELVLEGKKEFITMLELGYQMFQSASVLMPTVESQDSIDKINRIDKQINQLHRDVRKKIFEHLVISPEKDLFSSLVLLSVIDDSERIGDLIKNIVHIPNLATLKIGEKREELEALQRTTQDAFEKTIQAFQTDDGSMAAEILTRYAKTAEQCREAMEQLFKGEALVHRDMIAYGLLIRALKRMNAHLKNIASSIVNPYHRIGYKIKNEKSL